MFPWTAEKESSRHPMLIVPATAYEPDWRNVDSLPLDGVDEVVDLFAYPWPWEDNSVDELWASHIIEHIPHVPRQTEYKDEFGYWLEPPRCEQKRWEALQNLDGFYAFFAEVWRVLKSDGVIGVVAPYGKSDGALFDPQHTRFITEKTFHYLGNGGGNSPTYDYRLPLNFEAVANPTFAINPPWSQMPVEQWAAALGTYWNVCNTIRVDLRAVK